jgi:DNA-binding IclR family transcriptional regulator
VPTDHRVPVIDRMMDVLQHLERDRGRPTVRDLAIGSGVPRSTVYRILNTLEAHGIVVRAGADGGYQLGSRLLALAARVPHGSEWQRLAELAQPWLQRLAATTGETAKLTVLDTDAALCVAVAQGSGSYPVAAVRGARFPLHAGAASKVLLAAMDDAEQEAVLRGPLESFTPHTLTDPAVLRTQLARVRRQGWAEDTGEHSASIRAVAAPVLDAERRTVAALSIAHFTDRQPAERQSYREAAVRTAADLTLAIGGQPQARVSREAARGDR